MTNPRGQSAIDSRRKWIVKPLSDSSFAWVISLVPISGKLLGCFMSVASLPLFLFSLIYILLVKSLSWIYLLS